MLYTDPTPRDPLGPGERRYTEVHQSAPPDSDYETQAFHWGGLTAGSRLTAFWILLAPFAFANVAGWMSWDRHNRFGHSAVRLAGLGLTAMLLSQAFTALVLLPYLWVDRLGEVQILWRAIEVGSGLRKGVMLGLVVLLSALFLVLVLKASTQSHFAPLKTGAQARLLAWPTVDSMLPPPPGEDLIPLDDEPEPAPERPEPEQPRRDEPDDEKIQRFDDPTGAAITDPRLWRPNSILHRLRRLHVGVGLGIVAVGVAVWTDTTWALIVSGSLLSIIVLTTALTAFAPQGRLVIWATALAPLAALAVLIASLSTILTSQVTAWQEPSTHTVTFITTLVLGVFVLLSLTSGWIAVGALVIATLIGGILGIAVGIVVESMLGLDVLEANGAAWVAIAMLFLLGLLLTVALILSWWPAEHTSGDGWEVLLRRVVLKATWLFRAAAIYGLIAGGVASVIVWRAGSWEPDRLGVPEPGSLAYRIAIAMGVMLVVLVLARVGTHFGWILAPLVLLGAALIVFAASKDFFAVEFLKVQIVLKDNLVDIAVAVAIVVPGAFMLRSIWTGAGSSKAGRAKRRSVGILWDLGSFWPRWFHPLAPPAYGPMAVTELRKELQSHSRKVLAAHSQGSLIGALALIYTADDKRPDRLLTYGSQLGNLYQLMFPDVGIGGDDGLVERVCTLYPDGWVNLYRETDPIGGHYVESLDRFNVVVEEGTGHSRYEPTLRYRQARSGELPGPSAESPSAGEPNTPM
jgi:hypothetical protein